jgi:phage gp37-like protein
MQRALCTLDRPVAAKYQRGRRRKTTGVRVTIRGDRRGLGDASASRRREELAQLAATLAETRRLRDEVARLEAELHDRTDCLEECEIRSERNAATDAAVKAALMFGAMIATLAEQELQTTALDKIREIVSSGDFTLSTVSVGVALPAALGSAALVLQKLSHKLRK